MVGLNEAEALMGMAQPMTNQHLTTRSTLPGWGERQAWHCSKAEDGSLLVCLESLLKSEGA